MVMVGRWAWIATFLANYAWIAAARWTIRTAKVNSRPRQVSLIVGFFLVIAVEVGLLFLIGALLGTWGW